MKKIVLLLIAFHLFTFGFSQKHPRLNPDFEKYLALKKKGKWQKLTQDGHALGYIPVPILPDFSALPKKSKRKKTYPSYFDLRSLDWITPVKDQGQVGTCWAFAALGSIESYWKRIKDKTYNLSEQNMATCSGFELGIDEGGNAYFAAAYLSRMDGPLYEWQDPYTNDPEAECSLTGIEPVAWLPEFRVIPNETNLVKETIMHYGALATSMHMDMGYYSYFDHTYCYNGNKPTNHGVVIAGWDDTKVITAGSLSPETKSTGAWIVKNSYGNNWGDNGYFYVAYDDTKFLSIGATYYPVKMELNPNATLHYYDKLGGASYSRFFPDNTAWGLTKFETDDEEFLNNVLIFSESAGSILDIKIYSQKNGNELNGLLASVDDYYCLYPGWHFIDLPAIVNGEFYVMVKYYTPGSKWVLPVEQETYWSKPTIERGVNWVSEDGQVWEEAGLNNENRKYDLCIRAYTINTENPLAFFQADRKNVCLNGEVTFSQNCYNADSYEWDFGDFASPATATGAGPHMVTYSAQGTKTIKLIASKNDTHDTIIRKNYISVVKKLDILTPQSKIQATIGDSTYLSAYGADEYSWENNLGDFSEQGSPIAVVPENDSVVYTVTGTRQTCSGQAQVTVIAHNAPENDDIPEALELNMGVNGEFTNTWATVQYNEPVPPAGSEDNGCNTQDGWCDGEDRLDNSIWFYFIAPPGGVVSINSRGFDNQIAVYDAETADDLFTGNYTLLAANDDYHGKDKKYAAAIENLDNLTPGKKYWVQVDGSAGGATGNFFLNLNPYSLTIPELYNSDKLTVYPNPNSGRFTIEIENILNSENEISITGANGKLHYQTTINNSSGKIYIDKDLSSGVYFLKIVQKNQVFVKKLVIY